MNKRSAYSLSAFLGFVLITLTGSPVAAAEAGPSKAYGRIELVRDLWGIPHLFSDTDAGAMYGLGYATAEERAFQMYYNLRIIQGRLSEVVGERPSAHL